jgi:hypothetical protein
MNGDAVADSLDATVVVGDATSTAYDAGADPSQLPPPCSPATLPTTFIVPANGGTFTICGTSGALITLELPYQLAGLALTARNVDPASHAWPNPGFASAFSDLVALEPEGLMLSSPIGVRLPQGSIVGFVFNDDLDVPTPLVIPEYHLLPELHRLGMLAVVAAARSCESGSAAPFGIGWVDVPGQGGACSAYLG